VDWSEDDREYYEELLAELESLPGAVNVVTNWAEVADVLFNKARFPKREMERRIEESLGRLRRYRFDD
jgi:hypothetical protein